MAVVFTATFLKNMYTVPTFCGIIIKNTKKVVSMKQNKKIVSDSIIIGAALFAMFFGAGNMIFPPYLGLESGEQWLSGFLGYYVADIGLAILTIIAQINHNSFDNVLQPLGKRVANILMFAIVMCLGPLISIPRTCATTFELSVSPLLPRADVIAFSIIFFAVTLFLSLNESRVVDVVGKVLTPVLILGLLFLIVKGVLSPISNLLDVKKIMSPIGSGIKAGYQSMDVLGATVFGVLVINSTLQRGHTDLKSKRAVTLGASIIAGLCLFVIYLGLTYLGATASTFFDMHTSRADLLIGIIGILLPGKIGLAFFGVIAGLACLTTSIALTSSSAKYLQKLFSRRLSYKAIVTGICIFSAVVSSLGVERIVALASPILTVIYPPVLVVVIMSFFHKYLTPLSYRLAVLVAGLYGIADAFAGYGIRFFLMDYLPFDSMGMGWILPSTVLMLLGLLQKVRKNSK